jgi:hypothetical protein
MATSRLMVDHNLYLIRHRFLYKNRVRFIRRVMRLNIDLKNVKNEIQPPNIEVSGSRCII